MRKNLLFITADQWRGDCLSALGHMVQTPNLDALAAEGMLFTRHFANSAPCGPSRASIHTGMYQQNHRVIANGTPLEDRHTNWALEARRAGYRPALFGYTDTTAPPRSSGDGAAWDGVLPGLDAIVAHGKSIWSPDAWLAWLKEKGYPAPEDPMALFTDTTDTTETTASADGSPPPLTVPAHLHDTWFLVDQVLDYVKGREGWCVHLSLLRPHPPWLAPAPYNRLYPPADLPPLVRAPTITEEAQTHPYLAFVLGERHAKAPLEDARLRGWQSAYFGLMTEVDHNLGRLFEALKASGAWRNTLVVFTSDHGEQMGDHWLVGKLGYFDQSFRVPMILFNPSPRADAHRGARMDGFTESVDLMPTMLEWLGVDAPAQCDGESLLPVTEQGRFPPDWRTEAHWEFDFGGGAAPAALGLPPHRCKLNVRRGETFKYVHFGAPSALPPIYFDLAEDPRETTNLAGDPSRASAVVDAAGGLLAWRMAHDECALTREVVTAGSYSERIASKRG